MDVYNGTEDTRCIVQRTQDVRRRTRNDVASEYWLPLRFPPTTHGSRPPNRCAVRKVTQYRVGLLHHRTGWGWSFDGPNDLGQIERSSYN